MAIIIFFYFLCASTIHMTHISPMRKAGKTLCMSGKGGSLQGALLDTDADALNHGILLVLVGMVARLEASAEKLAEGLPEAGPERAQKGLDDRP